MGTCDLLVVFKYPLQSPLVLGCDEPSQSQNKLKSLFGILLMMQVHMSQSAVMGVNE